MYSLGEAARITGLSEGTLWGLKGRGDGDKLFELPNFVASSGPGRAARVDGEGLLLLRIVAELVDANVPLREAIEAATEFACIGDWAVEFTQSGEIASSFVDIGAGQERRKVPAREPGQVYSVGGTFLVIFPAKYDKRGTQLGNGKLNARLINVPEVIPLHELRQWFDSAVTICDLNRLQDDLNLRIRQYNEQKGRSAHHSPEGGRNAGGKPLRRENAKAK